MAKKEAIEAKEEMTPEEAKAYRASLYKPAKPVLTEQQKREQFRVFWAANKNQYGKTKALENILWIHLKAIKLDNPEQFEEGVKHFGLKRVK